MDQYSKYKKSKNLLFKKNNTLYQNTNENMEILESYKFTFQNNLFLQYDNKDSKRRILIFYTNSNLEILQRSNIWLCDGTFYTAPLNFSQVLIIHGMYFNKTIPLIYILMGDKSEKSYCDILIHIKTKISNDPQFISIDFEIGLYNAFKKHYRLSNIRGCVFHFCQIIVRYVKSKFWIEYKNIENFKLLVKYIYFLSFVPITKIEENLKEIKKQFAINVKNVEFIEYFEKLFILNVRGIENKKIEFWSCSERILLDLPHTNNSCEAYHRHLNTKIDRKGRNIGKIIDILKKEEQRSKISIELLKSGKLIYKKKHQY